MEDRQPPFRLIARSGDPRAQAWLDRIAVRVQHALEVTHREEYELAQAELREQVLAWMDGGTPPNIPDIVARFERRAYRLH